MSKYENLNEIVQTSKSYTEVLNKLGLVKGGAAVYRLKTLISTQGIDASHISGKRGGRLGPMIDRRAVKNMLIAERGYNCEWCGISDWRGEPIVLQMDHIDGNPKDHSPENIRLLCPNCHSQTPTYGPRNKRPIEGI